MRRLVVLAAVLLAPLAPSADAAAAAPGPGWTIDSLAQPTSFAVADDGLCPGEIEGHEEFICDAYSVTVLNTGDAPSSGPVTIDDELPPGVEVDAPGGTPFIVGRTLEESAEEGFSAGKVTCTTTDSAGGEAVECAYAGQVPAGGGLNVDIHVLVRGGGPEVATNTVRVEGGGAAAASAVSANAVNGNEAPEFGVQDFAAGAFGVNGTADEGAGDHPSSLTATLDFTSVLDPHGSFLAPDRAVQEPKSVTIELPPGLIVYPRAAARCPQADLTQGEAPACPPASRVGIVTIDQHGDQISSLEGHGAVLSYVYEMTPEAGFPAVFGFKVASAGIFMYASLVPGPAGYRLHVTVPDLPRGLLGADGVAVTFFGAPGERDGVAGEAQAFLRNPTACPNEPLRARVQADSWVQPNRWVSSPAEPVVYPHVSGCTALSFDPALEVAPETTQSDTPSGYDVAVRIPQAPDLPGVTATPDLRDATITLPAGTSLSPPATSGLVGCPAGGAEGIDIEGSEATELGDGTQDGSPYEDGFEHARPGHCLAASILGDVTIATPLLPTPLTGHVFLAEPRCGVEGRAPCSEADAETGRMLGLYVEARGSGVNVKLAGEVEVGGYGTHSRDGGLQPGQLRVRFVDAPQLPFSEIDLDLVGSTTGAPPLANPQSCGQATTSSTLTPWSAASEAEGASALSASFIATGCPDTPPFHPSFTAGTLTANAGTSSPLVLTLFRRDGEQDLSRLSVNMPPGLLAKLASVTPCGEPGAAAGACPASAEIGTATVGAGAGSRQLWLSGHVYLTSGYAGAPFGLSIAIPARAGPFELAGTAGGNVVVRAAIAVDPRTGALTISSDPLPQLVDGVSLRLRELDIDVDRPGFVLTPTSCVEQHVVATLSGALSGDLPGSSASVSTPFALTGCKRLPFKPRLMALAHAQTSRPTGAYLHVEVLGGPGQANFAKLKVDLPERLPARLSTLRQACPTAVFTTDPAGCSPASIVGEATAATPLLRSPLRGPAYLVSHGGVALPDLEIVLQAEGIVVELEGRTAIAKGVLSEAFDALPDAPIARFDLVLPAGRDGLLAASGPLCGAALAMPAALQGQNGAVVHLRAKIAVSGCPRRRRPKPTGEDSRKRRQGLDRRRAPRSARALPRGRDTAP